MNMVFIMVGIPGSGKSTYCKERASDDSDIVSADNYFVGLDGVYRFDPTKLSKAHESCLRRFINALDVQYDEVYVDNTNLSVVEIAPYYAVAKAYNYKVELVFVHAPLDVCLSRNIHNVPRKTMEHMYARFQELATGTVELPPFWEYDRRDIYPAQTNRSLPETIPAPSQE